MARKKSQSESGAGAAEMSRRAPMRDFSRSLPMSLLRAREAVMRQVRPSLRNHGLTEQQWRLLRGLTAGGADEGRGPARGASPLRPTLARILRRPEARHLTLRRAAKADLR